MKSFFTDEQWEWIAERIREGYPQKSLAKFLGVHRETIRRGLIRMGKRPELLCELRPLSDRKGEFYALSRCADFNPSPRTAR